MMDNWTITDADEVWDFHVTVEEDTDGTRPEDASDVYNADKVLAKGRKDPGIPEEHAQSMAQWARDAVKAWQEGLWTFVTVTVTPVEKAHGTRFEAAAASVGRCGYGWQPSVDYGKGVRTDSRMYVRAAWVDDLIHEARDSAGKQLAALKGESK